MFKLFWFQYADEPVEHKLFIGEDSPIFDILGHRYDIDSAADFENIPVGVLDSGYDSTGQNPYIVCSFHVPTSAQLRR